MESPHSWASQRGPVRGPHGLVHALPISSWAMTLMPFITTQEKALATSALSP
jgi:hypothetical protein